MQKGCSEHRPCQRCIRAGLADECSDMPPPSDAVVGSHSLAHHRGLPPPEVIDLCVGRFFAQLCPTIPILTEDYVQSLRLRADSPELGWESYGTIIALCAMVLLQVEAPDRFSFEGIIPESNSEYGRLLFDEATEVYHRVHQNSSACFDHVLLTFFMYACHASLFHHSRAFIFLREATTLLLLFRPENEDARARALSERLFWVLLISERSHAIRYRRPVTLQITPDTPVPHPDPSLAGFWNLAALFRPLDTAFVALLNRETLAPAPLSATAASLNHIEAAVGAAFDDAAEEGLRDTQKANLRVTQLWLRIVLWQLRLRLGHLSSSSGPGAAGPPRPASLTYRYPLEVAREAALSTRDLPLSCIRVHGVGLTEKLFDIACAVADVLARVPLEREDGTPYVGGRPEDDLRYLRRMITLLPGGDAVYDDLLLKHIQLTLPGMEI